MLNNFVIGPYLIVVTGLPASGKTTFSKALSKKFRIPLITKDEFKISLLGRLGKKDRAWDREIGMAAIDLQILVCQSILSQGLPVVLESNFNQEFDSPLIQKLIDSTRAKCFQVICGAKGEILYKRFLDRANNDSSRALLNHSSSEWKNKLAHGFDKPLDISEDIFTLDTTNLDHLDYSAAFETISNFFATNS